MGESLSAVEARIRRSLSLAQEVDIFVLVGPEHCGEETLEVLATHLAPDRLRERHRFHADGEALDATAAEAPNPLVLAWGLEYVPDDELTLLLVGLNHRRDRLRLQPATIFLWIPRPLLDEFSHRCQDLIEWRRLLLELDEVPPIPAEALAWRTLAQRLQRENLRRSVRLRGALEGLSVPEPDEELEITSEDGPSTLSAWLRGSGLYALVGHTTQGKSASVRRLARHLAREALLDVKGRLLLPGPAERLPLEGGFGGALCAFVQAGELAQAVYLERWADEGRLLLALDDVDRWDADRQRALWRWCEAACKQHPKLGILVIGRSGLELPPAWHIATPKPWGESEVMRLLRQRGLDEATLQALMEKRLGISSPYLAEIIAAVYQAEGRLPDDTYTLLDRVLAIPADPTLDAAANSALSEARWDLPLAGLRGASVAALEELGARVEGKHLHFTWHLPLSFLTARSLRGFDLQTGEIKVFKAWEEHAGRPAWDDALLLATPRALHLPGSWERFRDRLLEQVPETRRARVRVLLMQVTPPARRLEVQYPAAEARPTLAVTRTAYIPQDPWSRDMAPFERSAMPATRAVLGSELRDPAAIFVSRSMVGPSGMPGGESQRCTEITIRATMTPTARRQLQLTIRDLHDRLQVDLRASAERHWRWARDWPKAPNAHTIRQWQRKWGASEAGTAARARVEALVDEAARAERVEDRGRPALRSRLIAGWVREAAYTLLHRLVILRVLEEVGLARGRVVTAAWESTIYKDLRQLAPGLIGDDSEGMGWLLDMLFDELSLDLPGVFGDVGLCRLIPVPAATLRHTLNALNDPTMRSCWSDDTAPGWIYQYWNDPDREALDRKLSRGGKLDNDEIASKTQLFTERYLVEWLLQNSLGPLWLRMCHDQGWTPEAVSTGALDRLTRKRAAWRSGVAAGEIPPEQELPIDDALEDRWKYYVPQALPTDHPEAVPGTLSELRLLDPACGSGHFLVVAFELLFALYQEEARHRGLEGMPGWTDAEIAASILEKNLAGLDLDPRAVQIAAAALWIKARRAAPTVSVGRLNLVASDLGLREVPADDPALQALREALAELGVAPSSADGLLRALADADHLGALLQVDATVEAALDAQARGAEPAQPGLFERRRAERRAGFDEALERFLSQHTASEDLGLRLRGEQLAKGARFVRLLRPGSYHLVVGNPPYQNAMKIGDKKVLRYLAQHYAQGRSDLYAAFMVRSLCLVRKGGLVALLTMRGWMFNQHLEPLRLRLLASSELRCIADLDRGAFRDILDELVAVSAAVLRNAVPSELDSIVVRPTPQEDRTRDTGRTDRKRASLLGQREVFRFRQTDLSMIETSPVIYWWTGDERREYADADKIGAVARVREGLTTSNNGRFLRLPFEVSVSDADSMVHDASGSKWAPYIKGSAGLTWFEPLCICLRWCSRGLEVKVYNEFLYGSYSKSVRSEALYFQTGVAFTTTGTTFTARIHRFRSVFGVKGRSVFYSSPNAIVVSMNTTRSRRVMDTLNPTLDYTVGDVNRLPLFPVDSADEIVSTLDRVFTEHESHREPSIEFRQPGPSAWDSAQLWAQQAVDRPSGTPLPPLTPTHVPEPPTDHLSYALGVALGRFAPDGSGVLDPTTADLSHALPRGILFLVPDDLPDELSNLGHPAAAPLRAAWAAQRAHFPPAQSLAAWLRERCFPDVHRPMYENRPIHWPLSSERRGFVAWVQLHRMDADTLPALLADHVRPALVRVEGQLADLHRDRMGTDRARARDAERRLERMSRLHEELSSFATQLQSLLEKGPPPASDKAPRRERDARWAPELDDGVRVQSGSLWPLLEPQWKDPRRFWGELCAEGDKNDDWSQTARRYFPERVARRCVKDPSLAVAHGRFWELHPELAYLWELRLARDLGPDFRIDEPGAAERRESWLAENPDLARKIEERARRGRRDADEPDDAVEEEAE